MMQQKRSMEKFSSRKRPCLCKAEDIAVFLEDWRSYDQELQAVMQIMNEVLWKKEEQHG